MRGIAVNRLQRPGPVILAGTVPLDLEVLHGEQLVQLGLTPWAGDRVIEVDRGPTLCAP